ncbi:ATP-binding protein [Streptomyces zaomyceticus]|uniref:ATP-binding protein n=1 Tax=Streptomyces zaomyceticus TaxID=68286 RepID=UPI0036BD3DC9
MRKMSSKPVAHHPQPELPPPARQRSFCFPAVPAAVPVVRERVTECLCRWEITEETRRQVAIVVSELFTNVLRHTESENITCVVVHDKDGLELKVSDRGRGGIRLPTGPADDESESGRGLLLVQAMAGSWGFSQQGEFHSVWACWPREALACGTN